LKSSCKCSRRPQCLIIENQLHSRSRAQPTNALPRLGVGHNFAIRIRPSAANFLKLCIRQPDVTHMLDVVEERSGCGVLILGRESLDLSQSLLEQLVIPTL
jgi:hypothetical protein